MESFVSEKSLRILKKSLPSNGMQAIADELGVNLTTISRIFSGKIKKRQHEVVEIALGIVERERRRCEILNSRIEAISAEK